MTAYWVFGRHIGLQGYLVKFFLLYWSRYVGFFWHLVSLVVNTFIASYDPTWTILNTAIIFVLEYLYFAHGAGAVSFVDPDWTQGEDTLLPFEV